MQTVIVRRGHVKPLWAGHPWVHAEGVLRIHGEPDVGAEDVVLVVDGEGRPIGRGFFAPNSALRVRLLERGPSDASVASILFDRIDEAAAFRRRLFPHPSRTNAYRLVHAEADGLPGLIVDRFDDQLVAQFSTGAMHRRREALAARLLAATGARTLTARAGGFEVEEGIAPDDVSFRAGDEGRSPLWVREEGLWLEVDPLRGQKTGHFADQRENRVRVAELAVGRRILDLFAGTGAFSLQALRRGALQALAVDTSKRACETARRNAIRNGVSEGLEIRTEDMRAALAALREAQETYDLVVLDPPNFFPRRGGEGRARRAYRDLNVQALIRTRPGGILATFSCSARMGREELRATVASAALECRRPIRILRTLEAGPDHPVLGAATEGRYLSGLLVQA